MAGKVAGDESCWKYVGQKVEIVGTAQSITKETRRIRRLAKITGIKPLYTARAVAPGPGRLRPAGGAVQVVAAGHRP